MNNRARTLLRALLREPLVSLFAIGACIYLAYGLASPGETAPNERVIAVTAGEVDWLKTSWQRRWRRPPTERELEGLLHEYIKETVLYREALAMGLDEEDPIVRRRLAQKLTFLTSDLLQPAEPTEDELRAYFEDNVARYREPDLFTFSHVFVDPDKRGARTLEDARAIKASLDSDDPAAAVEAGDSFMLQAYFTDRNQSEIGRLFGHEFARALSGLEPGQWHGPIRSGYGAHLVYVHNRLLPPAPSFDESRDAVRKDWAGYQRGALNDQFIQSLLGRYEVVIEEGRSQ